MSTSSLPIDFGLMEYFLRSEETAVSVREHASITYTCESVSVEITRGFRKLFHLLYLCKISSKLSQDLLCISLPMIAGQLHTEPFQSLRSGIST